ncbi:MAG: arginine N-succinyltransferase [Deltaproteobacteria bacterium]|nr:arginine N-succinyltransferase [Deltaproteobacteria bacterium]
MVFVRPVSINDLDTLVRLAGKAGYGLTSLPADRELLRKRIAKSELSFASLAEEPGGETYTLVMEDRSTGEVIGTGSIVSKVGGFEPFYAYKLTVDVHESKALNVHREIPMLELVTQHSGPCEIGGLFMDPERRGHGNGRLMSLCRFLFMAEHGNMFEPLVTAEMRGVVDASGRSPFWEALGKLFFGIEYPRADYLSMKDKKFIGELMPRHPIYVPLLPAEAQKVIGQVHENTRPAMKLLLDEGFSDSGMVDIFDAGPILTCALDQVRTIRQSVRTHVESVVSDLDNASTFMISNTAFDFRACNGPAERAPGGGVRITESSACVLRVKSGDRVLLATPRSDQH